MRLQGVQQAAVAAPKAELQVTSAGAGDSRWCLSSWKATWLIYCTGLQSNCSPTHMCPLRQLHRGMHALPAWQASGQQKHPNDWSCQLV